MSRRPHKPNAATPTPPNAAKPFAGLKRADIEVLKPGAFSLTREIRRLRDNK